MKNWHDISFKFSHFTENLDKLTRALSKSVSTTDLFMHRLLRDSTCMETNPEPEEELETATAKPTGCTLSDFEEKAFVKYRGHNLEKYSNSVYRPVSDMSFELVTELKKEIESYIPVADVKDFQILDPQKFPTEEVEQLSYGLQEIGNLAELYSLNRNDILEEWFSLVKTLTTHNSFCIHKRDAM